MPRVKDIRLTADFGAFHNSIDFGLCDSLGRAMKDLSDVAEINTVWLLDENNEVVTSFTTSGGNVTTSSGDDGTDGYVDIVVKDYSSNSYQFKKIVVGHQNLSVPQSYSRAYVEFSGDWSKDSLEFLKITIRLWIRG